MKRILYLCAAIFFLLTVTVAGAQSLGDLARQQRQVKRPSAAKVYTNDDIPMVAASSPAPAAAPAAAATEKSGKKEEKGEANAGDEKAKAAAAMQAQADALKKEITQLEREYTVSEREYKLRSAVYYADAGNSLRDPKKWAEQDRQYQAEMADKRKAIDAAKQKLSDLQDEARKADIKIQ